MNQLALQADALTRKYQRRLVVDHLSLSVERGDVFGFLGQNGAGKSTTIRMALGLVRPTSGRIEILGHDMARRPRAALKRVGAIIEAPAFYENFSGQQNLRMLAAMSGGATPRAIEGVLELVGLRERARDPVRVYSHGMRQRLGIAQALLPNPELIILDEPTDGLDPQGLAEVRDLIGRLRDERRLTIVLSSHLLHEVEQVCNRVAIIDDGRLLYEGSVQELVAAGQRIRLKTDRVTDAFNLLANDQQLAVNRNGDQCLYLQVSDEEIPDINALLVRHGFRVTEISAQRESLEEVFLRLTREARIPEKPDVNK
ncbi:MAG TPA: ABC transporter ATP-binding protein [Pyrinomonadaceae bacterium]|jgi:ABC-2 type transport system ATP-binding protein|nr:ABC transporter ATP-binding protein [Pyrinomonadaceae bacterium]